MTAVGTRPTGISTLEQDIIRQIMAYKEANPRNTYREEGDIVAKVALWNLKINDLGEYYFVGRVLVPVSPLVDGLAVKKLFMRAIEIPQGASAYPAGYDTL
jgi:hypothetical protein